MYVEIILAASEYENFIEMMRSYKQKLASEAAGAQWAKKDQFLRVTQDLLKSISIKTNFIYTLLFRLFWENQTFQYF